jgi:serine protease Do
VRKDRPASLSSLGLSVAPSSDGSGVSVTSVEPNSAAAERGIKNGDTILEIDGKEVADVAAVNSSLDEARREGRDRILMLIRSGERQRFVALPVGRS